MTNRQTGTRLLQLNIIQNTVLAASMFRSKPVVRFLIPDPELGTIMEKSADLEEDVEEVAGDDTNSHDNCRRPEHKTHHRKRRKKSNQRRKELQREESIRKEEVSANIVELSFFFEVSPPTSVCKDWTDNCWETEFRGNYRDSLRCSGD